MCNIDYVSIAFIIFMILLGLPMLILVIGLPMIWWYDYKTFEFEKKNGR